MANKTWISATSGNWNTPGDWSGGLPGPNDLAAINETFGGSPYSVDITDSESTNSVYLTAANATLWIEAGASLVLGRGFLGVLQITAGTLELSGLLEPASLTYLGGTFIAQGGTLDATAWYGELGLTGANQTLYVENGLGLANIPGTAPGELAITGNSDLVEFLTTTDLNGFSGQDLTIQLGGGNSTDEMDVQGGHTLTLDTLANVIVNSASSAVFVGGGGTIVSAGTFTASGSAVTLNIDPLTFTNSGNISFSGGAGGQFSGNSLSNTGSITLSGGGTVSLSAFANSTTNSGVISVSGTNSWLDMEGDTTGGGVIEISNNGTATIFGLNGTVEFLDATGSLQISNSGTFAGTIEGFQFNLANQDTIELINTEAPDIVPYTGNFAGGTLTLEANGLVVARLDLLGDYTNTTFNARVASLNTFITLSCFAAGTRIQTEHGEVAVEALQPGQLGWAHSGDKRLGLHPIVWIVNRPVDCLRHPDPQSVLPVRIVAGAFGPGQPRRDLLLSPDHAVFVDDVLIPIHALINGTTIARVRMSEVTYYHIELAEHAVLLAEGLPVESYLDAGDRSGFVNGGGPVALHPNFVAFRWEADGCAPLVTTGPKLAAVRRRINAIIPSGGVPAATRAA